MKLQFDDFGNFRIVHDDGTKGEWANYRSIALLKHQNKTYIAATQYGLLPLVECIYELGSVVNRTTEAIPGVRPQ